jgi:hypothetical protein
MVELVKRQADHPWIAGRQRGAEQSRHRLVQREDRG